MAGEIDVDAMLRRITAKQLREWEIYYELEPFGELRSDYRTASIVQMIANVNRGAKDKPYKLEEFLLQFGESEKKAPQKPKQTWQEQARILTLLAKIHNSTDPKTQDVAAR